MISFRGQCYADVSELSNELMSFCVGGTHCAGPRIRVGYGNRLLDGRIDPDFTNAGDLVLLLVPGMDTKVFAERGFSVIYQAGAG